ncbi:MAG: TerB family tellurite resistance protein [Polyangiaceae bacterium]|nr:TerB family tellurite resistance protein [Polyangiaceae bacterium]
MWHLHDFMSPSEISIVKSLIGIAWADGVYAAGERAVIGALLDTFGATAEETAEIERYASEPQTLDRSVLAELESGDRAMLLEHAVLLSMIDGEFHKTEEEQVESLRLKLEIPEADATPILESAKMRASQMRALL